MFLKLNHFTKKPIYVIVCRCCGAWLENEQWRYGTPPKNAMPCVCPKCKNKKNQLWPHDYR